MTRRLDWPERMADALAAAEREKFSDSYCCAAFAADVVLAMTDFDPYAMFRGLSVAEARESMREQGWETLEIALASLAGVRVRPSSARRGDVVLRADGEAVGICCGQETAFISSHGGLAFLPTLAQRAAFRVP